MGVVYFLTILGFSRIEQHDRYPPYMPIAAPTCDRHGTIHSMTFSYGVDLSELRARLGLRSSAG
jgi:hypothetical protein